MSLCKVIGLQCSCQPDEGVPCPYEDTKEVVKWGHEWRDAAMSAQKERDALAAAEARADAAHEEWQGSQLMLELANTRAEAAEAERDALRRALRDLESAVDWFLGRSAFTQSTNLKGLAHSERVRKALYEAHDAARAALASASPATPAGSGEPR